jgi:hypothetical protein
MSERQLLNDRAECWGIVIGTIIGMLFLLAAASR